MHDDDIELSPDLSAKEYARRQSLRKKQRTPHSVNITFTDEENEEFYDTEESDEEENDEFHDAIDNPVTLAKILELDKYLDALIGKYINTN